MLRADKLPTAVGSAGLQSAAAVPAYVVAASGANPEDGFGVLGKRGKGVTSFCSFRKNGLLFLLFQGTWLEPYFAPCCACFRQLFAAL